MNSAKRTFQYGVFFVKDLSRSDACLLYTSTNQVMQIWLNGNMEAHPFVAQEYWQSNYDMVQEQLLQAEVFVLEADGVVQGFIGLVEGYIAGIFVAGQYRSMGVGRQLLDYAKQRYNRLMLSVYQQNERAIAFYRREGFAVSAEGMDEETGSAEYTMTWRAQDNACLLYTSRCV